MRIVAAFLCAAGMVSAQQHGKLDAEAKNPFENQPEAITVGRKLFLGSCSGCHGAGGEGGRGPNLRDGRVVRRLKDEELFSSLKHGVKGSDMPASTLPDESIWKIAAFVRAMNAPAADQPPPGDVSAGQAVFRGKGGCAGCHMIGGQGGYLGPDLSNLGAIRSAEQIRDAIVKPNETILRGYTPVRVTLKSGPTLEGAAKNYSNYDLQLVDAAGSLHLLRMSEIARVDMKTTSPMPDDLAKRLTRDEMTNLIAYLSRQSVRTAEQRKGDGK